MNALLDVDAIKRANPLPVVAGRAGLKLIRAGSEHKACCPFHPDRTPSFTIFANGLRFHCHGCGVGGDVFDFLARLHGVGLREAAGMLDGNNLPSVHVEPPPVDDKAEKVAEAKSIWRSAQPAAGTFAESYLRARGITIRIPDSIRFTRLPYGKGGCHHPCLVAVIASADNKLIGIQRTFLNADGTGKAAVPKPKLSLGRITGGAIRLAPAARSMVICEGLEDGLTLHQELGRAVWVAAGATNLPRMQFPRGVEQVAIGGDNDEAGRAAARNAANALIDRGIRARAFFPVDAKDFNAELMGRAGV